MKIAYLSIGGHIHTQRWLSFFVGRGHDVHLLTRQPHEQPGVVVHRLDRVARPEFLLYGVGLVQLRRILRRVRPDILHAHFLAGYGYWAACSGFRPLILTVWGDDVYLRPYESPLKTWLARFALRRADLITGDSRDLLAAAERLGAASRKCRLVQWGVDFDHFHPGGDSRIRAELDIPSDATVVLSARSFTQDYYNIDTIVEAAGRAVREDEGLYFLFAGLEGDDVAFRAMAERHGLRERSRWLGRIPHTEFARYVASSDVYVSVPSVDATAVSLLEAMACGCAIIVSDLPSNREWIDDDVTGCIVAPRAVDQLTDCILRLARQPSERRAMGARCVEVVKSRAVHHAHMSEVERLYLQLRSGS